MSNEIEITSAPELDLISESKSEQIKKTFEPMADMLSSFEEEYNTLIQDSSEGIDDEITKRAKRLRLDIGKVRIQTGKLKDKQKEYIKLEDKAIMGVHNILVWAVKEKEDKLKEIEKHFEIQEQKRLDALQKERVSLLSPYVEDADERDLSKFEEDEFQALLAMKKKEQEDRIEAERIAEEERIAKEKADAEERERIRKENEKLKAEAERLAKIEEERKAKELEAQRKREEAERKERELHEAALRKEREERERIENEERKKREELEAQLKAKEEAERKAKEEEEARLQEELSKGDSDKVDDLIKDLEALKTKYTFESELNKKMYANVCGLLDKVIAYTVEKTEF